MLEVPMPRRPKPVHVGELRAYAVRGPKDGAWYWRVVHCDAGQRTLHCAWSVRADVERLLARMVAEDDWRDDPEPLAELDTVDELMRSWLVAQAERVELGSERGGITPESFAAYKKRGRFLCSFIGDIALSRLDVADLERARDAILRVRAPRTTDRTMRCLRMAWSWGRPRGLTPDRGLPTVRVEVERDTHVYNHVTPTPAQAAAVASHLEGDYRRWFELVWATGARTGTICRLRWADVDHDTGVVWLLGKRRRKVGAKRPLRMGARLRELLVRPEGARDEDMVLSRPSDNMRNAAYKALQKACVAAKVPAFSAHGLRRLASTVLIANGTDPKTYEAMMGHSWAQGMATYAQVLDAPMLQAVDLLGRRPTEGDIIEGPWKAVGDE